MSRLGIQISQIRTKKGITQKQLANKVGVSEKYIDEVESGKRIINDLLIKKISKVLDTELNESFIYENEVSKPKKVSKSEKEKIKDVDKTQAVWSDAFASVLKEVPVYKYSLNNPIGTKMLPVISNKIDNINKDKVCFVEIEDDDMIGFRISKGDIGFCYMTHELDKNGIYLIEYNGKRCIRQIKKLDANKILLISNKNSLITDTLSIKDVSVLARLIKLEIKL